VTEPRRIREVVRSLGRLLQLKVQTQKLLRLPYTMPHHSSALFTDIHHPSPYTQLSTVSDSSRLLRDGQQMMRNINSPRDTELKQTYLDYGAEVHHIVGTCRGDIAA